MLLWLKKNVLYIAWAQALVATLGSLYFSEILHWAPCVLCWWQRIMMYPLVFIIAVGILRKTQDIEYFVLPFAFTGFAITVYHNLLQYGILSETLAPCVANIPCITNHYIGFGFITIPFLTLVAFAIIIVCMFVHNKTKKI